MLALFEIHEKEAKWARERAGKGRGRGDEESGKSKGRAGGGRSWFSAGPGLGAEQHLRWGYRDTTGFF